LPAPTRSCGSWGRDASTMGNLNICGHGRALV
jgi:hypothetical protein